MLRMVEIKFPHRTAMQMVLSAATTFAGTVSNIGGTLGLFCGFSIISGLEIFFWTIDFLSKLLRGHRGKHRFRGKIKTS